LANSLTIESIDAAYGHVRVLEKVSLNVNAGETVVLLGTNGNGKSTLMKCVMGIVRPNAGRIVVEIDGETHDLVGRTTEQIVDLGIALVPEGRRLFPKLTVEENLLLGAFRPAARAELKKNLAYCLEAFPVLGEWIGPAISGFTHYGIVTVFFTLIYKWLPTGGVDWRFAAVSGAVNAILFAIGNRALVYYFEVTQITSAFGATAGFAALLLVFNAL